MNAWYLVLLVPVYFVWVFLHEGSHVVGLKVSGIGLESWKIKILPYRSVDGSYRFAGYTYKAKRKPNAGETVLIKLAPRLMNLVAVVLFPFGMFFSGVWSIVWFVVWGCGLIDLLVGSVGYSKSSDLVVASRAMELSPWVLRIVGFVLLLVTVLITGLR